MKKLIIALLLVCANTYAQDNIIMEDSIRNIKAEIYAMRHSIDLAKLTVPDYEHLPATMKAAIDSKKREAEELPTKDFSAAASQILKYLEKDKNYQYIKYTEYWMAYHYDKMVPELIKRLTDRKEIGLENFGNLIIRGRAKAEDLKATSEGDFVADDLYTTAGRANHLLTKITGVYCGSVQVKATDADLKKLQNRWAYWLLQLQKK